MSLQVWLPFNNNINNQGVTGALTQVTAPTYVDGKIGKAMSTGAVTIPAATAAKFYNNKAMSFCFWIYTLANSSIGTPIIGQSAMAAGDNRMFTIFQYPTSADLHLSWQNETATGTFLSGICTGYMPNNTWTHIAITYDGSTAKIYQNGIYKTSVSGTSARKNFSYNVPIPNCAYRYLNDFRIYDEVLSEKQIKEISKALVVHFPLDDQYGIGKINKYNAPYSAGECGPGSFTRTKLTNERGYNYKLTRTGTGSSSWPSMGLGAYTFTVGKRYYYSCKVRCNKWTSGGFYFRAARSSNDWVTSSVQVCSPSLADGKWHEYYTSVVVNETYDRSGTTVPCSPRIEFYTSDQKAEGTVFDMDFDLKDLQVVESDVYMPFIENDFASNIMSDTSGFRYDATSSGAIKTTADTPKYSCATYFPSGSGIFAHPNINLTAFTISFWAKHTATGRMVFGSSSEASSTDRNWYWYGDNSFKYPDGEFYYQHNAGSAESLLNKWTHFVAVYNGSTITVYRNSVNEGNQAASGTKTLNYLSVGIGYGSSGYWENSTMSDFRLYATALSSDDIKELYQVSASIDTKGNIIGYDFQEG